MKNNVSVRIICRGGLIPHSTKISFIALCAILAVLGSCGNFLHDLADSRNGGKTPPPVLYTVTFDANGGNADPAPIRVVSGQAAGTLPVPVKTGAPSDFQAWFTKDGSGGKWGYVFDKNTIVTSDITVYARWDSGLYALCTVTFDSHGGGPAPAPLMVLINDKIDPMPVVSKPGPQFRGWWTKADPANDGTEYNSDTPITTDITLHAQWRYTVYSKLEDPGHPEGISIHEVVPGGTISPFPAPTKSGYTFIGWWTAENGGTQVTAETIINSDMTIYAKWTQP